ncbi:MAG: hypothetical protein LBM93_05420 [Oscillospiraceae bacterium]|jgi:spore cortex biosynthesis protein YabQ|nr:hypothetical protein [Oscillospiraceae bacterium]
MNITESFYTLNEETRIFLASCLVGLPLGIFFDIFRTVRIVIPHKDKLGIIATAIEDIIFLFVCSVIMLCFMSIFVKGQFRFIYCFGAIWGFLIYYCSIGEIVTGLFRKIVLFFTKIYKFFLQKA